MKTIKMPDELIRMASFKDFGKTEPKLKFSSEHLLRFALMELDNERDRCRVMNESYDCMYINGMQINEIIRDHLSK
jgi:hypothetical protein